jgi:hypothetical protein
VAFFSKEGLEIVSGLDFLLMSEENSMRIWKEWVGFRGRLEIVNG